jgi:hypothetical protein
MVPLNIGINQVLIRLLIFKAKANLITKVSSILRVIRAIKIKCIMSFIIR